MSNPREKKVFCSCGNEIPPDEQTNDDVQKCRACWTKALEGYGWMRGGVLCDFRDK